MVPLAGERSSLWHRVEVDDQTAACAQMLIQPRPVVQVEVWRAAPDERVGSAQIVT
jgi:hypothetical protein